MRLWCRAKRLTPCGSAEGCMIQPGQPYSVRDDGRLIRCEAHSPTPLDVAQLEMADERQAIQQEASGWTSAATLVCHSGALVQDVKMRAAGPDGE